MAQQFPLHQDARGRRSRFHRQPTGKTIRLTKRDIELFLLLYRYRYLATDRILKHFSPCNETRMRERLGDLYHEGHFITRPPAQWNRANAGWRPIAYELTTVGLDALLQDGNHLTLPEPIVSHAGIRPREIRQFNHALAISHMVFDLEHGLTAVAHKYILFENEILKRASAKLERDISDVSIPLTLALSPYMPRQKTSYACHLKPDALFAVETRQSQHSGFRFYALEMEIESPLIRRTPKQSSTLKKLLSYQQVLRGDLAKKHLSLPNLYLVIGTQTLEKQEAIKQLAKEIWSEEEQKRLLFVTINDSAPSSVEIRNKWAEHFKS